MLSSYLFLYQCVYSGKIYPSANVWYTSSTSSSKICSLLAIFTLYTS